MVEKPYSGKLPKTKNPKANVNLSVKNPGMADLIGQRLRSFYDDAAKQPIPDRFLDLLKKLEGENPPEDEK